MGEVQMRSNLETTARRMLESADLYRTAGRIAVLKVMLRAGRPMSRKDIAGRLSKHELDKVTVYRIMECLVKAGLVHRAYMEKRAWHYELSHNCTSVQCHPHFTCRKCGLTECLLGQSVPMIKGMKKGFVIQRQQVRLEGLCPKCA